MIRSLAFCLILLVLASQVRADVVFARPTNMAESYLKLLNLDDFQNYDFYFCEHPEACINEASLGNAAPHGSYFMGPNAYLIAVDRASGKLFRSEYELRSTQRVRGNYARSYNDVRVDSLSQGLIYLSIEHLELLTYRQAKKRDKQNHDFVALSPGSPDFPGGMALGLALTSLAGLMLFFALRSLSFARTLPA